MCLSYFRVWCFVQGATADTLATHSSAEGFKVGGGVAGVRTQCYMASYWPTD